VHKIKRHSEFITGYRGWRPGHSTINTAT